MISLRTAFVATLLTGALAAGATARAVAQAAPAPAFGAPPSGDVPILYNDRHVYSTPSELKAGRVLGALVRGDTVLVPLRTMFQRMGAAVDYDASTKTVRASKPGVDIKVTVGKAELILNGEARPLRVPPEIYRGAVVVPIRVISEALGAYVQWVPEKNTVVVRHADVVIRFTPVIPVEPPIFPAPLPTPSPTPSPSPTPLASKPAISGFVAADWLASSKIHNELAPGVSAKNAYDIKAALEIPLGASGILLGGDFRQYQYQHSANLGFVPCADVATCSTVVGSDFNYRAGTCPSADPGCVTVIGHGAYEQVIGKGQAYVPAFVAQDRDYDARLGLRVASPRIYVAASYLWRTFDYLGYPTQHGLGFGLEKLPDLDRPLSWYGSAYYYPSVSGNYTGPTSALLGTLSGAAFQWQYRVLKYEIGATYSLAHSPIFLEAGWLGDRGTGKLNAPSDYNHNAVFVGGGLHI